MNSGFDWLLQIGDASLRAVGQHCRFLRSINVANTNVRSPRGSCACVECVWCVGEGGGFIFCSSYMHWYLLKPVATVT